MLSELDYRALRYLLGRCEGTKFEKQRLLKKWDKAYREGRLDRAKESADDKWRLAEARFMLGEYGDWSGWEFRDQWAASNWFKNPFPVPVWDGSPGRVYVIGEQGVGDEVFFAQCLVDLKKRCEVVLETQPKLIPVLSQLVECVPAKMNENGRRVVQSFEADYWVALGELPRIFRKSRKDFPRTPYLDAKPDERYRGRVGISWRGNQGSEPEILKAFPDALSLQYDQHWDEECEQPSVDLYNDLQGVFSVIRGLDRVVTVSTSVAHFASAMGVPCDVILASKTNQLPWKWLNEACPGGTWWYPQTTRVFRNWNEYRHSRAWRECQRVGGADRPAHGDPAKEPSLAAA